MNKILVHICCGVDAIYALKKLKEEFPKAHIEGYFYDPNIHPEEEYILRWIETKRVCNQLDIKCHQGEYDVDNWLNLTKGLEQEPERGKRCEMCHDMRLNKTAEFAIKNGFDAITTVLLMSPKKDFETLSKIGTMVATKYGLKFLAIDFRKKGGIEKMNKLSKEAQLYHQNYCGCFYALYQQRKNMHINELISFGKGRLPGSREELLFVKKIRLYAEEKGLKCNEIKFQFINWRVIHSILKIDKNPIPHNVFWLSSSINGTLKGKIEKILKYENNKIVKINKGNTEIWITNKIKFPQKPRYYTNPIFVVEEKFSDLFQIGNKVEFQLKSKFIENGISQTLIIGKPEAERVIEFHSDSLPDGKEGISEETIIKTIDKELSNIFTGKTKIHLYGAKTAGNLGRLILENHQKNSLQ